MRYITTLSQQALGARFPISTKTALGAAQPGLPQAPDHQESRVFQRRRIAQHYAVSLHFIQPCHPDVLPAGFDRPASPIVRRDAVQQSRSFRRGMKGTTVVGLGRGENCESFLTSRRMAGLIKPISRTKLYHSAVKVFSNSLPQLVLWRIGSVACETYFGPAELHAQA